LGLKTVLKYRAAGEILVSSMFKDLNLFLI